MKNKSQFLIILAASSVIVSAFVLIFVFRNVPVNLPFPSATPTVIPLQTSADLNNLSADLDKTDFSAIDKQLNLLSSDSSGF